MSGTFTIINNAALATGRSRTDGDAIYPALWTGLSGVDVIKGSILANSGHGAFFCRRDGIIPRMRLFASVEG
jgi:hypothetical protein